MYKTIYFLYKTILFVQSVQSAGNFCTRFVHYNTCHSPCQLKKSKIVLKKSTKKDCSKQSCNEDFQADEDEDTASKNRRLARKARTEFSAEQRAAQADKGVTDIKKAARQHAHGP